MLQYPTSPDGLGCCVAWPNDSHHSRKDISASDGNGMEIEKTPTDEFAIPLQGEDATCDKDKSSSPSLVDDGEEKSMTHLFSAIESEKWDEAILFLETGSFFGWGEPSFSIFGCGENNSNPSPKSQVRTWVVTWDWWGNIASRRLPIHAAVVKKAPLTLIQKLLEMYPEGIRCKDTEGNLPLHLSFKHDSPDGVVAFLLKSYPEAVGEKNNSGCQPVDYASADACEIIQVCVEQTNKVAKREEARLCQALEVEKTRLTEILSQLSEIRGELDHLRKGKNKSTDQPEGTELKEMPEKSLDPGGVSTKKQKSDRKLRLPWMRKKVGVV